MKKSDLLFNFNLLKLNQYFIPSKEWVFYLYCPQNNYRYALVFLENYLFP